MHTYILSLSFLILTLACTAQQKQQLVNANRKNIALEGYDAVGYFRGSPTKGDEVYSSQVKGFTYHFANAENKKQFDLNPSQFLPKYGGYCAYAMGIDGSFVDVNPETYKIIDNELYLFYNKFGINTLDKWNEEGEVQLNNQADQKWKAFSNQ